MLQFLQSCGLGYVLRHSILVVDEGLAMVEDVLEGRFLHAEDLEFAVVGVVGWLEVLYPFGKGELFLGGKGVAHVI
jgi:hypothetical protein